MVEDKSEGQQLEEQQNKTFIGLGQSCLPEEDFSDNRKYERRTLKDRGK
jgi:hypothetical protein